MENEELKTRLNQLIEINENLEKELNKKYNLYNKDCNNKIYDDLKNNINYKLENFRNELLNDFRDITNKYPLIYHKQKYEIFIIYDNNTSIKKQIETNDIYHEIGKIYCLSNICIKRIDFYKI